MGKTLTEIAEQLSTPHKIKKLIKKETKQIKPKEIEEVQPVPKVQLIYAFNGTGKTRLSRILKDLIIPKNNNSDEVEASRNKYLYYNAFTEDLFYWDNDLQLDTEPKLKIQPNSFTDWILTSLQEEGIDNDIITKFQHYSGKKITPKFNPEYKIKDPNDPQKKITISAYSEVIFSITNELSNEEIPNPSTDNTGVIKNIKISKGEESNFIWSIFYTLLEQVILNLNTAEAAERETDQFNQLEYIFIDDPVSSLDENHLIELAVNLADLIKSSTSDLKFIVTTHNPLFYNVLYNELNKKNCYILERFEDGTFALKQIDGDSNDRLSYHLYIKKILEKAVADNQVEKYHFTLLRNLYEKTASFLGYPDKWSSLLPGANTEDRRPYLDRINKFTGYKRIIQSNSHSTLSYEEVAPPSLQEKQTVKLLLDHLIKNYGYYTPKENKDA